MNSILSTTVIAVTVIVCTTVAACTGHIGSNDFIVLVGAFGGGAGAHAVATGSNAAAGGS